MAGPLQVYLFVHDAILREIADFEETARELKRDDPQQATAFRDRVTWFHTMMKAHEAAEDTIFFPALDSRYRNFTASYQFDHDFYGPNYFDEIDACLAGLSRPNGNGEQTRQAQRLHRQSIALNESVRLHVAKENELLVPVFDAEIDPDEQVKIAAGMAGSFEPKLMAETIGWMYRGQSTADREGMIRFFMRALPAEAFGRITQMLSQIGSADDWREMTSRIPELESKSGPA